VQNSTHYLLYIVERVVVFLKSMFYILNIAGFYKQAGHLLAKLSGFVDKYLIHHLHELE